MVCNKILYSVDLACPVMTKISLSCQNCSKSRIICYAKNVENHGIFVEGFWPEFYARGRFMKYSMSGASCRIEKQLGVAKAVIICMWNMKRIVTLKLRIFTDSRSRSMHWHFNTEFIVKKAYKRMIILHYLFFGCSLAQLYYKSRGNWNRKSPKNCT